MASGMDAHATICSSYPYTLTNGQIANADQVMANFNCALLTSGGTAASPNFTGTATGSNVIPPSLLTHQNANTVLMNATGTSASPTAVPLVNWLLNYKSGLTLSTAGSSGTFGISVGEAADTTNASLMALGSAYTKTTGSWAVGSGNGCLDTGSIATGTWYSEFIIQRTDTGVTDILCSLSATSPTLPANYTVFRRIGSMRTDGSANWIAFVQTGNQFLWVTPILDVNAGTSSSTSAQAQTLTVPTGVPVFAQTSWAIVSTVTNAGFVYVSSLSVADIAPSFTTAYTGLISANASGYATVFSTQTLTNTSAKVRMRWGATDSTFYISTIGWIDPFGGN